ncbi:MAG: cytochrome ubiquinol oxidase subunit I [Gemmatimonadaceae bacterium]
MGSGHRYSFRSGAVSGTVLSFELGLLWPTFMKHAGPVVSMPFSLEGFAFFTEAIFLGIYLYAWKRISARAHLAAGVVVAISGALSGAFVVCANAWMNAPTGFTMTDGVLTDVDPIAAMFNDAAPAEVVHMMLAAYAATAAMVAGIHAYALLRGTLRPAFHRAAVQTALFVAVPAVLRRRPRATALGIDLLHGKCAYSRAARRLRWYSCRRKYSAA